MSEETQNDNPEQAVEEVKVVDELTHLKQKADRLGITYHPNIGVEKLREKINEKIGEKEPEKDEVSPEKMSKAQRAQKARKEATKLVRVRVTCMNPNKKEWQGDFFAVSNSLIGTVKKYVPFGVTWHVPQILLKMIKARQFQQFYTITVKGQKVTKGRLVKEFGIEVLNDLTESELKELARKQALRDGTAEE